MSDLITVEGQACLDYIDKPIGFIDTDGLYATYEDFLYDVANNGAYSSAIQTISEPTIGKGSTFRNMTRIAKWEHNTSKRIVGVVKKNYETGGLYAEIYGDEQFIHVKKYNQTIDVSSHIFYKNHGGRYRKITDGFNFYPSYSATHTSDDTSYGGVYKDVPPTLTQNTIIPFDDAIDFNPDTLINESTVDFTLEPMVHFNDGLAWNDTHTISRNNPLIFGEGVEDLNNIRIAPWNLLTPVNMVAGNLYNAMYDFVSQFYAGCPEEFADITAFYDYVFNFGSLVNEYNFCAIPFNIILTNSKEYAFNYLDNGTLPPDAYLYVLDWSHFPTFEETTPTGDEPEDYPDDNNPDDDERDFDPTPNETPTFTVNQFTNYNWYWLTVPQWSAFISWFWNDIGNYSDFDDIIAKVKGLYNDVASAVIMCRYYPVDISWIGGLGTQSNIKLGMIEKAGAVDTISQASALRSVDIGHVHIGQKYKSFMDMSPYSQLSLYLPWHGFIDLDMNLFNGHDVYVKALYDYLSGTIQYYVFYDNEVLVNTILCKMAMDIPITLQTKNDRDSAIFNNVSSTIGGLVGAGAGILSGNPIGMTLGITQGVGAFNSANASAPMRLMGNVGESGAYIGCQNCFVVVRRPTIQASDGKKNNTDVDTSIDRLTTWKKNVGMLCGYGYKLSSLSGKGFTVCHSPRINFTNSAPLQSEVDEIYNYLEKGVIL